MKRRRGRRLEPVVTETFAVTLWGVPKRLRLEEMTVLQGLGEPARRGQVFAEELGNPRR